MNYRDLAPTWRMLCRFVRSPFCAAYWPGRADHRYQRGGLMIGEDVSDEMVAARAAPPQWKERGGLLIPSRWA